MKHIPISSNPLESTVRNIPSISANGSVIAKSILSGLAVVALTALSGTVTAAVEGAQALATTSAQIAIPTPPTYLAGLVIFASLLVVHARQVMKRETSNN